MNILQNQPQNHHQNDLQNQAILILGLGASGLAMARWCVRCGAHVTVADTRANPPQRAVLQQELPQVRFVGGAFSAALIEGQNWAGVYRSPGLSPESIAPILIATNAGGIRAGGELSLFSMALESLRAVQGYAPTVLAITGTNGKTTVTSLTGQLVERAGKSVAVAGNIGPTLLDTLSNRLDAGELPEVWVLELSSFQLDGLDNNIDNNIDNNVDINFDNNAAEFEPTAATVLNITQDHLDWHGNMAAYAQAKARIFGAKGRMVLNREDPTVMAMLPQPIPTPPKKSQKSQKLQKLQKPEHRAYTTFGSDMPQRPGDFGMETAGGMVWLVRATESPEAFPEALPIQRLMPVDALRIRGRHNALNALAALALAESVGCALAPMLYGLREYRGEPHRVEPIGLINGIEYFDDSKGTNVGATVAALTGLGVDRRVVVILGGEGKGQDFSPLVAPVACHARAVVLIGRDAPLIGAALQATGVPLLYADCLPDAVQQATAQAHPGDAVLMSPACASFDMFKDYEHRARVFYEAVETLAEASGQILEGGL